MKVKELIKLLNAFDKEAEVLIADDGSILKTAHFEETEDYNEGNDSKEFYIVTEEWE